MAITFESEPTPLRREIAARATRLLLRPSEEWRHIADERISEGEIFRRWVMPLAAIGPTCHLLGSMLFTRAGLRPHLLPAIGTALVQFLLQLVGVFVAGLVIDALARQFGGARQGDQALKVAAFSATASWLAAGFALVPALSGLSLLGLYSLYLLYTGLPICMRAPREKAFAYTVATVLVTFGLYVALGLVLVVVGMAPFRI